MTSLDRYMETNAANDRRDRLQDLRDRHDPLPALASPAEPIQLDPDLPANSPEAWHQFCVRMLDERWKWDTSPKP